MDYTSFAPGNNSINNQKPIPSVFSPTPQKNFTPKFIVLVVLLLLLGTGAYAGIWYWQNQQVTQEVVPTFTPRVDATADWKTYTNTKYGFEFKYPGDWEMVSYDGSGTGTVKDIVEVGPKESIGHNMIFYVGIDTKSPALPSDLAVGYKTNHPQSLQVAGVNSIEYSGDDPLQDHIVLIPYRQSTFVVSTFQPAIPSLTAHQILSTFKFTK